MRPLKRLLISAKTAVALMAALVLACLRGSTTAPGGAFASPWFLALLVPLSAALTWALWLLLRRNLGRGSSARGWGGAVLHLGLLLLIVSGVLTFCFETRGFIQMIEGEVFEGETEGFLELDHGVLASPLRPGFQTRLAGFRHEYWPDSGLKALESDLEISFGGRSFRRKVAVNSPVTVDGVTIYQSLHYGYSLSMALERSGEAPLLTHFLLDRPRKPGLPAVGGSDIPGTDIVLRLGYYPGTGRLQLRVLRGGATLFRGLAPREGRVSLPEGELALVAVRPWTGLIFVKDAWAGAASLGLLACVSGAGLLFMGGRLA